MLHFVWNKIIYVYIIIKDILYLIFDNDFPFNRVYKNVLLSTYNTE